MIWENVNNDYFISYRLKIGFENWVKLCRNLWVDISYYLFIIIIDLIYLK